MNCSRCGFENEQDASFCSHCGAPFSPPVPQPSPVSPANPTPQPGPVPQPGPTTQTGYGPPQSYAQQGYAPQGYAAQGYAPQSNAPKAPPRKKRTGLIIGLVAGGVALIGAAVAAYFLFFSGPAIKGLWVCDDRGWALRIEDSVLTEYSPAGTDKTSYTVKNGQGETMLSGGEASFTVKGDKMSLVDEETGDKYLFERDDDADVESVVTNGLRGLWSSEEQGTVFELGKKGSLTAHSGGGELEGNYEFDLKSGSGTITLGEDEYGFTAGWDSLTVDTVGGFMRADEDLDVAAFVQQYGTSPLLATWYETTGQYGSLTFKDDDTFVLELYGVTATGTYTFDTAAGSGTLTSDDSGETTTFTLLDGALTLEGMTYTQDYVEQPSVEDFFTGVEGTWNAVEDSGLSLEFAGDGTVIFYSGGDGYGGTYTFNPVDLTGTFTLTDFPGTTYYTFSVSGDTLYVGDYPYSRTGTTPITSTTPADTILGTWYDEEGQAGTLYFDKDGMVLAETSGEMNYGTYTFDEGLGSGSMKINYVDDTYETSLYLYEGKLYTESLVYTQSYVEQVED